MRHNRAKIEMEASIEDCAGEATVAAVIVVYNDFRYLDILVSALHDQVDTILIIDNSDSGAEVPAKITERNYVDYHRFGMNRGLGVALNKGIELALKQQVQWILLLDQDSIVSSGMVRCMIDALHERNNVKQIGLICPNVYLSERDSHQYPLQFGVFVPKRVKHTSDIVDFTITSGSMIKAAILDEVGCMDESFFIDYIDYDFCLRIRRLGYKILFVDKAVIRHRLGEKRKSNIGLSYASHPPQRIYYQTRNRMTVVSRYASTRPSLAIMQISLLIMKFFKIIVVEEGKIKRLKFYFAGIRDFACGKSRLYL